MHLSLLVANVLSVSEREQISVDGSFGGAGVRGGTNVRTP